MQRLLCQAIITYASVRLLLVWMYCVHPTFFILARVIAMEGGKIETAMKCQASHLIIMLKAVKTAQVLINSTYAETGQ